MTIEQTLLANNLFVYHAQHNVKAKDLRALYAPDASVHRVQEAAARARLMDQAVTRLEHDEANDALSPPFSPAPPALLPTMEERQKYSESGGETTWEINLKNAEINALGSLPEFLAFYKVDTLLWEVKQFEINGWNQGAKNEEGVLVKQLLCQIKAILIKKKSVSNALAEIESLKADAKLCFPIPPSIYRSSVLDPDYCLELSLPDAHFGKLAWGEETGWGDYDTSIAASRYREAIATLMHRTNHFNLSKILFVLGNDLFNADNKQNLTTKGTPQDTDSRYQKSFITVRRLVIEAILTLRQKCPVEVVMVPGNHDQLSTFHLGDSLECRFDSDPEVAINNAPSLRKHFGWGNTHILWTHGDREKISDLPLLMAAERKDLWYAAAFHEIHMGHLHKVWTDEKMGVRIRRLPSLSGTDAWHSESGYVGNIPSAEGYVYHRKEGIVDMPVYNVLSS